MRKNDAENFCRTQPMTHERKSPALGLMLLLLPLLLTACATPPSPPLIVPPPAIPPLPAEARQTSSPTHSQTWQRAVDEWRQKLTPPSSPAQRASAPTTP